MKPAFFNIQESKREKIIGSCIDEFAKHGYEKSSTDRIIKKAGISKGGLYEYISSKEELFLFTVEHVYKKLYDYIRSEIKKQGEELSGDILLRLETITSIAVDFYIGNPDYIKFISSTYSQHDQKLEENVRRIFMEQFMDVFGKVDKDNLLYDRGRLIDLIIWLLTKTREDFLHAMEKKTSVKKLKNTYLENLNFYMSLLRTGIYNK